MEYKRAELPHVHGSDQVVGYGLAAAQGNGGDETLLALSNDLAMLRSAEEFNHASQPDLRQHDSLELTSTTGTHVKGEDYAAIPETREPPPNHSAVEPYRIPGSIEIPSHSMSIRQSNVGYYPLDCETLPKRFEALRLADDQATASSIDTLNAEATQPLVADISSVSHFDFLFVEVETEKKKLEKAMIKFGGRLSTVFQERKGNIDKKLETIRNTVLNLERDGKLTANVCAANEEEQSEILADLQNSIKGFNVCYQTMILELRFGPVDRPGKRTRSPSPERSPRKRRHYDDTPLGHNTFSSLSSSPLSMDAMPTSTSDSMDVKNDLPTLVELNSPFGK